ncbi:phytanoyl-CoA dioxygenase family protein [Streptomyces roseifaciens]
MALTQDDLARYRRDGFVVQEDLFTADEVDLLCDALTEDARTPGPQVVTESDGRTLRAVYAPHLRHPVFHRLARTERLLGPARQIAGDDLYVHQMKVNVKQSFAGERWAWHQDYIVWRDADGMPAPSQVNVALLLDDCTEFNGPVIFLRGSHTLGTLERDRVAAGDGTGHIDPDRYALSPRELSGVVERHEMVAPKAGRGSVLFFSPQLVHGSNTNVSPHPRRLLILTYNPVPQAPRPAGEPRPEYLVGRARNALEIDRGLLKHA